MTYHGFESALHRAHDKSARLVVCAFTVVLRRSRGASMAVVEPLTVTGLLLAAQGLIGSVQYELHLPTDIVWVHVTLATLSWLAVLWAVADAGRLAPRTVRIGDEALSAGVRPVSRVPA